MESERAHPESSTKIILIVLGIVGGLFLLCAGALVVCIVAITTLGQNANGTFDFVSTKVSSGGGSSSTAAGSVEERVIETIADYFDLRQEQVRPTRTLRELAALAGDDLDLVELTIALEDKFAIKIADEEAKKWKTVGDVIDSIYRGLPKGSPRQSTAKQKEPKKP